MRCGGSVNLSLSQNYRSSRGVMNDRSRENDHKLIDVCVHTEVSSRFTYFTRSGNEANINSFVILTTFRRTFTIM